VANNDAPTRGQDRLRPARKKRELSADDFLRTARYSPNRMLELKTTRQMAQSIKPREKDMDPFPEIGVLGEGHAFPDHAIALWT
jgi:hypothetical protein